MIESVRDLIKLGFEYYHLNRIEIHCATENHKSLAIREHPGLKQEGIIRKAEKVYDKFPDLVVYGLLKEDSGTAQGRRKSH